LKLGKVVPAKEAIQAIAPGSLIVFPGCCSEPQTLIEALLEDSERLAGTKLISGLLFSNYSFVQPPYQGKFRYATWHVMRPIRDLVIGGEVEYLPIRGSQIVRFLEKNNIDVVFIQTSPPDRAGYLSLGASVSYIQPLVKKAKVVIAEVNRQMPYTLGDCFVHINEVNYLVESDRPLIEYHSGKIDEISSKIGAHVIELLPDQSVLQIGIGSIPEAVLSLLSDAGIKISVFGMAIDTLVDLSEKGVLVPFPGRGICSVVCPELVGTEKIFKYAHTNPLIELYPSTYIINPLVAGRFENFISINSALEIDLLCQVNAETINGIQISGVGGGFDFVDSSLLSKGGKSIIVMPSVVGDGKRSRIVPYLVAGTPVAIPRHSVQYVVTEYGIADLQGKSVPERARALIEIAHPAFRDWLEEEFGQLQKRKK
jgi:4-hydroxybutyrate CoA-transferase